MQQRQGNTLKSLRAVQDFLDTHASRFPTVATSPPRGRLDEAVARLEVNANEQDRSARIAQIETRRTRALAARLRKHHMVPIARVARDELPATEALLPLRLPNKTLSMEQLAVAARGMAQAAAPYAQVFIDGLRPVDFIAQLEEAVDTLMESVNSHVRERGRRQGATAGMRTTVRSARLAVLKIDSVVRLALEGEPELLSQWNAAKDVRRGRGAATAAPSPVAAPAGTPVPVAA